MRATSASDAGGVFVVFPWHFLGGFAQHELQKKGNYSGLLQTCQSRENQLKYNDDERRRTASPARRKSNAQSVGSRAAPFERAVVAGQCPHQGARRPIGTRQSNEQ